MKLYRFMGEDEFQALLRGDNIVSDVCWQEKYPGQTTAHGVCFWPETIKVESLYKDECLELSGSKAYLWVWAFESDAYKYCVEFETRDILLDKAKGKYRHPEETHYISNNTVWINEYCTKQYSKENLIPLRYKKNEDGWEEVFKWIEV